MKTKVQLFIVAALVVVSPQVAAAVSPTPAEMGESRRWVAAKLEGVEDKKESGYGVEPFFSFIYGGQPSAQLLGKWKLERSSKQLDAYRTQHTLTYRDPETGLVVRCTGVAWKDYPTAEWTLYFKNEGAKDTPLLETVQALDTTFQRGSAGEFVLHHHLGDTCSIDAFAPLRSTLGPNALKTFASAGGRPTSAQWPYYNLELPHQGKGVLIVLAWPGQWASRFQRDGGTGLRVMGGQELTRLRLRPGEEIRTPLVVLQFYQGDWIRGQNIWRRWMLDRAFPKDHGEPLSPKLGASANQFYGFNSNQAGDIELIDRLLKEGIGLDYW